MKNSGHRLHWDQPDELVRLMSGFFKGTITHHFELKPREEFVADTDEVIDAPNTGRKYFLMAGTVLFAGAIATFGYYKKK